MTFLSIVAKDLIEKTENGRRLSSLYIVFPNKRASLFFNEAIKQQMTQPVWSPHYSTISELFLSKSRLEKADHIRLIMELYQTYIQVTGLKETLDQFYNWGELMLADFDDVDKHLADAAKVFRLIGDLHELDNVDYLTEEQQRALQRFFSNFTAGHSTELKRRFLQLWNKFFDIYTAYRERLQSQGIAYEGMLYRQVIEEAPVFNNEYVFVGFNLLNTVEQQLFLMLQKEGKARFYWDFDEYYMSRSEHLPQHEAGRYIREHLRTFPNELPLNHEVYRQFSAPKKVAYVSSSTDDLQARYVAEWLTPERIAAGPKTAIVLADEGLLETVLNCLPPEVKDVNITTGFPLAKAPVATFVKVLILQLMNRTYTLHRMNAVLRHAYAKYISDESFSLHERLNKELIYYPTLQDLGEDENLKKLFAPLNGADEVRSMNERLIWAVRKVAVSIRSEQDDFHNESLYRMYEVLNRLKPYIEEGRAAQFSLSLYLRLLTQIIQQTTIPFHGEPLTGIQIMGVLETRNLDFEHVLILSASEGNIPKHVTDSSFIPHNIRRAYELTTIENKVGIYSYYFHRLLQRSHDVCILYNNATNDGKSSEMSRFMLQLLVESDLQIHRQALSSGQVTAGVQPHAIDMTEDMVQKLLQRASFSPSALGKYLRCPLIYYYNYIEDITQNDETDEEEMDGRAFGKIFHKAAELLYAPFTGRTVTAEYLSTLLDERGHVSLQRMVDQAFREELFNITDEQRKTPKLGGLQVVNREIVLRFLIQLIKYDMRNAPFRILGLELPVKHTVQVSLNGAEHDITIGGYIDRLDCVKGSDGIERVRVIDYKTGAYAKELNLDSVEEIFNPQRITEHSDYFLQALLYSDVIEQNGELHPIVPALLYILQTVKEDYSPVLQLGKLPILDARELLPSFRSGVRALIEEILDADIPFRPYADTDKCNKCIYKQLCYC